MPAFTTVIGNVVRDPEGNDKHVRFTVASNEGYGDKAFTSYYKVWVFNGHMDRVKRLIKKGSHVAVSVGELKLDTTGKTPELNGVFMGFSYVNSGRAKPATDEDREPVANESNDESPDWPAEEEVKPEPAPRAPVRRNTSVPKGKSDIPF
jgi:single-stranded DNA-binding protein